VKRSWLAAVVVALCSTPAVGGGIVASEVVAPDWMSPTIQGIADRGWPARAGRVTRAQRARFAREVRAQVAAASWCRSTGAVAVPVVWAARWNVRLVVRGARCAPYRLLVAYAEEDGSVVAYPTPSPASPVR